MAAPKCSFWRLAGLAGWLASMGATVGAAPLPAAVSEALRRAHLPEDALVTVVQEVGAGPTRLSFQEHERVNPASVFKLITTYAALDLLGPAWTWRTPVYLGARPQEGLLKGSVWIKGSGDPKLVLERVWLLLRQLQARGVRHIQGDIVLDRSAWTLPEQAAADFDGDASRPYNVRPDPLLLNFKTVSLSFSPDPASKVALISAEPKLAGVEVDASVSLASGPCDDWRGRLKADWSNPQRVHFSGSYLASCGEQTWPVAYAQPRRYNALLIEALWREMGGQLSGSVREGTVPIGLSASFELASPPLAEVVRDINKFSNNVMAEQLFYSLASSERAPGSSPGFPEARALLEQWLRSRLGEAAAAEVVVTGGSGLSREARVSAGALASLLQQAWSSAVMPELVSSLPVSGLDGTLRRAGSAPGRSHLKTGTLRDVVALAGYVLANNGRRYVMVAILNHPQAEAGRPALDALTQWVVEGAPASEGVVQRP